ncbi:MAG: DNA translocase FtsK [Ruminococcaceae bacterium]|nr:DNA translocase FtsK [Oscillospiraceae bacterium]
MATKKSTSKKKTTKQEKGNTVAGKRHIVSIICFAVAVFTLCVVLIPGENVWRFLHNFSFGLFGWLAYFYPFLIGFIAVLYAFDKFKSTALARTFEAVGIVLFIGALTDLFIKENGATFGKHLSAAYTSGVELKGSGFIGALFGRPIELLFGNTGAIITVFLIIFVLLMILTGTTLVALFKSISKPVKKIEEHASEVFVDVQNKKVADDARKRSEVDIPVDDIPEKRTVDTTSLSERQKKVVEAYNGIESAEPTPEDNEQIDDALEEAKSEKTVQRRERLGKEQEEKLVAEFEQEQKKSTMVITENDGYKFPPISLLKPPVFENTAATENDLDTTAAHLVDTLRSFGVETRIVDISRGPTVTRYELQPCAGVKISKITNLADDIALNLATAGVRIEAPIPNKAAVGIEVPNKSSNVVGVREIIESPMFTGSKSKLTVALGRDIAGNAVVTDIAKMPHGLIAGATGSGKSVCINSIIMSILYKATPEEVKLLMIDPKVVELGVYNGIPHLLVPVVTDPRKAAGALGWAVTEMEQRYAMFAQNGVRDLAGYNKLVDNNPDLELTKMPQIVIIIDELADLMMTAPSEVEDSINRIAAKARAAGMHLLIATQRPSVDVVTGVIKANIPSRIAFAVSSQVDSRTILDMAGAEKLLGRGDMLFNPVGCSKPNRLQGCFVSDEEVEAVVDYIKGDHSCEYDEDVMQEIERQAAVEKKNKTSAGEASLDDDDPMLNAAIETVVELGQASTSMLQRKLKLGYARAARLIDIMEERGVVGPYEGSKPRQVLMTKEMLLEKQAGEE